MKKKGTVISITLSIVLLITSLPLTWSGSSKAASDYGLENPKVAYLTRDIVEFGHYWQEDINGDGKADENDEKTPIRWQVLERNGDELLLLSDKILDNQKYNSTNEATTWELCSLRTWLNGEFYNNAFSTAEKTGIKECNITNPDNPSYGTDGGNNTKDNVFLLSLDEIKGYGFNESYSHYDQARQGKETTFAKGKGLTVNEYSATSSWWLRSPGSSADSAALVYCWGCVYDNGDGDGFAFRDGVRPALRISLSSVSGYVKDVGTENVALKAASWDTVKFGSYGGNTLTWRVLNVNGNEALLLSENIVDIKAYNDEFTPVTWSTCTLRTWLNSDFYNSAFTSTQRAAIRSTIIVNSDNPYYGTSGGNNTSDKIYLLSLSEVTNPDYGFPEAFIGGTDSRIAYVYEAGYAAACAWWLRSPGESANSVAQVSGDGTLAGYGYYGNDPNGIRPALHIDLSSSAWMKGDKIIAGDEEALAPTVQTPPPSPDPDPTATPLPTRTPSSDNYGLENPKVAYLTRDIVEFGHYWQEDTNGDGKADENDEKTPIRWQVLERNDDELLLLSDKVLDKQAYHSKDESITWERCSLRTWLNSEFLNNAFSLTEKAGIKTSVLANSYYSEGEWYYDNTEDKIFLLSVDEAQNYGFGDKEEYDYSRKSNVTPYAQLKLDYEEEDNGYGSWRLRSSHSFVGAVVESNGWINTSWGADVIRVSGVRPVLRIDAASLSGYLTYIETKKKVEKAVSWDTVIFGNYKGKDLIWRVLDVEDGKSALLLADDSIETKKYKENGAAVSWRQSTIRKWLNDEFLNSAFDNHQAEAINNTVTSQSFGYPSIPYFDKVFLLSETEAVNPLYGFPEEYHSSKLRGLPKHTGVDYWWLRSNNETSSLQCVYPDGSFVSYRIAVDGNYGGVRPALRINLSSSAWIKGERIVEGDEALLAVTNPTPSPVPSATPTATPTVTPTLKPTATPTVTPTQSPTQKPSAIPDVTAVPDPVVDPEATIAPEPTAVPEQPTEAPSSETSETGIPTAVPSDINTAIQTPSPVGNIIYNIYNTNQTTEKEIGDNQSVKKGMKFFAGNLQYKVTSAKINQYEVSVIKVKNKKAKSITIDSIVVYKGNNFKITGIGKKFASGCAKLKKINIKSKYIKKVEKKAFAGIKSKYKILVVKSKLKKYAAMIKKAK